MSLDGSVVDKIPCKQKVVGSILARKIQPLDM